MGFVAVFGVVSGAIGIVTGAYGIIDSLVNRGMNGDFGGEGPDDAQGQFNQQIATQLTDLQTSIDSLQVDLTDLITTQIAGVRQQALMSAFSRAQSARDLLASIESSDTVPRSEIIADASRAFRDVLAQAREIATTTDGYSPTTEQVQTAFAAVSMAIGIRLEVAARLESDELGSNKINRQISSAATFFRETLDNLRDSMVVDLEITGDRQLTATLQDLRFEDPDFVQEGEFTEGDPVPTIRLREVINFEASPTGTLQPVLFNGGEFSLRGEISATGFPKLTGYSSNARGLLEPYLENQALDLLGFGLGGSVLFQNGALFDSLADGDELVLPNVSGGDSSGTLDGTPGNDLLIGNVGDDTLNGLGDGDILKGRAGDDTLNGGDGEDLLQGNDGDDTLNGGADDDILAGGSGDDTIDGGAGSDKAGYSGKRADYTITAEGDDFLIVDGPDGRDRLVNVERIVFEDATVNVVQGDATAETLASTEAGMVVWGKGGGDTITGAHNGAVLIGSSAADTFIAEPGQMTFYSGTAPGTTGPDTLTFGFDRGSAFVNLLVAETPETMRLTGPLGDYRFDTGFGQLRFADGFTLQGSRGGDGNSAFFSLVGNDLHIDLDGSDSISTGDGDDFIITAGNDDTIDGGADFDTARIFGVLAAYDFDWDGDTLLVRELAAPGRSATRVTNVELLQFDDVTARVVISGDSASAFQANDGTIILSAGGGADSTNILDGAHVVFGDGGDDDLRGGPGDDRIAGGADDDTLTGNAGRDQFIFEVQGPAPGSDHGIDRITDFIPGEDKIVLKGAAFARVANGVEDRDLAINFFPDEAEDVLFTMGDMLFVDPDGNGAAAPIAFARLDNAATLRASDFIVDVDPADLILLPPPPPSPPNIIMGKATGFDLLQGTDGDDIFVSLGGRIDTMTGGMGADVFVFGAEASDGNRDRDVITDYQVGIDAIGLQTGAVVKQITAFNGNVSVFLAGDDDAIVVRGDDVTAINLTFLTDFEFSIA